MQERCRACPKVRHRRWELGQAGEGRKERWPRAPKTAPILATGRWPRRTPVAKGRTAGAKGAAPPRRKGGPPAGPPPKGRFAPGKGALHQAAGTRAGPARSSAPAKKKEVMCRRDAKGGRHGKMANGKGEADEDSVIFIFPLKPFHSHHHFAGFISRRALGVDGLRQSARSSILPRRIERSDNLSIGPAGGTSGRAGSSSKGTPHRNRSAAGVIPLPADAGNRPAARGGCAQGNLPKRSAATFR